MTPKEANAALIKAARTRDIDALKAALAAGADVNKADSLYGVNALANMSMFTDEEAPTREVIKILLDAGSESGGAVGYAAQNLSIQTIKLLVEAGVDVNDWNGWALRAAAGQDDREEELVLSVVKLLLEAGANPNLRADYNPPLTALACAASAGYVEVVKLLIEAGATVDTEAAEFAMKSEKWREIASILFEKGAPITGKMFYTTNLQKLQFLVSNGADIPTACAECDLILRACESRECTPELVQYLVDMGADVNKKNSPSSGPMLYEVVRKIIDHLQSMSKYKTVEEVEEYRNRVLGILACLIKAGVDINAAGGSIENTALIEAVDGGEPAIVKLLIEAGADVNAEDKFGRKAQAKASCPQPQKKDIQDMLKEARAAVRAAAKAAAKEAAAASGEPKAAPKKACAAKSTAKKTTGTKSTTTKKTTTKKKAE